MADERFEPESGQQLDIKSLARDLFIRRRWWIIITTFAVALPAIIFISILPNRFRSDATLEVVRPQVPIRYAENARDYDLAEEVNSLKREILSRKRLLDIINTFDLYPDMQHKLPPEALVEVMKKDVEIVPLGTTRGHEFSAFRVSFFADTPRLAQDVGGRITSLFIEENLKAQSASVTTTTKFLDSRLEAAKARLDAQERKLRDFKASNLSELPENQQANLSALTDLRIELQGVQSKANRAQSQRYDIESTLNGIVARIQSERLALLNRFTAKHPDIVRKDADIERAQALLSYLKNRTMPADFARVGVASLDPSIASLKTQIEANIADAESAARDEQRLRAQIATYQGRMSFTPLRDQQLQTLVRDYDLYKADYADLASKQFRAQGESNLADQQAVQHYRLIDNPTLPRIPASPDRLKLSAMAIAAALGMGIVLAFLRGRVDPSFHSEQELRSHFSIPLVVGVPNIRTPIEERAFRWKRATEWLTATCMLLVLIGVELYAVLRA